MTNVRSTTLAGTRSDPRAAETAGGLTDTCKEASMASKGTASRFWDKVWRNGDECWEWTGARIPEGYGQLFCGGRVVGAHRIAYEMFAGSISAGLELDHLCRNPGCVNPDHLEPVTHAENLRRSDSCSGINSRKTHCVNGHLLSGPNLYVRPDGRRECRTCARASKRRYRAS